MQLSEFSDKTILFLGLGKDNLSALRFLSKNFPSKRFAVADKDKNIKRPGSVDKMLVGDDYLKGINDYQVIIKSPGVPFSKELQKAEGEGKIILSPTSIFFDNCSARIVGVTGTKGKSTTSSLIFDILKAGGYDVYLVGNIGTPALDILGKTKNDSIVVYELSSFQLSGLTKSPNVAVITNLYPEHLDSHGSFDDYRDMKANITKFQTESDFLIYNDAIPELAEIAQSSKAKKIPFTKYNLSDILAGINIPLLGKFNLENLAAAVIVGQEIFNILDDKIKAAILNFHPLAHRLEFVGNIKGIKFYNDSLATIPQATIGAINALGEDVETLITGGFDRGIDYSILGPAIVSSGIKNLIIFPTTGEKIWKAVQNSVKDQVSRVKSFNANTMKEAVDLAFKNTTQGKTVLLSPASSSFNMFKNYEDRGNQFKTWVKLSTP